MAGRGLVGLIRGGQQGLAGQRGWLHAPWIPGAHLRLQRADTLELLGRAPDPDRAARLSRAQLAAALRRANRRIRSSQGSW